MIVSIHQPNYIPWLGYFYKIAVSDIFVFLDNVQFTKGDFINRVKIYSPQKEYQWLTIPVNVSNETIINTIEINHNWQQKHLKTIVQIYSKAKYFNDIFKDIEKIYLSEYKFLSELNMALSKYIISKFHLNTKIFKSSDLDIEKKLSSDSRLIEIVKRLNGMKYLSGSGGFNYQSVQKFNNLNIDVLSYSINKKFTYETKYKDKIGLSILDFIFNEGFNRELLLNFGEIVK
ncbi:WbqC family protein [Aliarcobacter butzleri]|uniref:WbqC family protein n=1 Tax=Aliarcobacter butzleri TaxID=28197 RepID=UPI001EDDCC8D|nr:WbqC family protein [Aliarcobacter butzleri]MCG3697542.1 WbqC family protein [Aliarcobacter butzleri]MCG3698938.1 WbqC family protein [Aliarcobacter butzleri]MCT7619662.1 WbqC family protein [Aliarcobacter butzleri]MDN5091628.1 WbqC family protein [Aliarcobacter butzleri]